MFTLPDFKQKQILFIDTRLYEGETKIKFVNENIVFYKDEKIINRASCYVVMSIFIIGEISITSKIIKKSKEFGISIFLMNSSMELYAEINYTTESNYLIRRQQYLMTEEKELDLAKFFVVNKIKNQFRLIKQNDNKNKLFIDKINTLNNFDSLRGVEGLVAKNFFKDYFVDMNWKRREPRVKGDVYNLLLDIGYTRLFNFVETILRLYGFDVYKGFYHKLFFARKSLVSDVMEPFRCIIDKKLLKMHNLKQIKPEDFKIKNGKYILEWEKSYYYHKLFMEEIMDRKEEIFLFVQAYYRHIMYNKNELLEFNINKDYHD